MSHSGIFCAATLAEGTAYWLLLIFGSTQPCLLENFQSLQMTAFLSQNHAYRLLLESNVERGRAHKFYFKKGLTITSYRFAKDL